MVRLLKAQKEIITFQEEDYYEFAMHLMERLLEIFPSQITPEEDIEIRQIARDWSKKDD